MPAPCAAPMPGPPRSAHCARHAMREARKRDPAFCRFRGPKRQDLGPRFGIRPGTATSGREAGYNHALKCCRRMGALSRLCSCITIGGLMRNISRRGVCAALSLGALSLAGCQNIANQNEPADNVPTISDSAGTDHAADEPVEEPEDTSSSEPQGTVERLLATMTLEQKVAQLFLVTPEQLTGVSKATVAGSKTERALQEIPVGGLVSSRRPRRSTSSPARASFAVQRAPESPRSSASTRKAGRLSRALPTPAPSMLSTSPTWPTWGPAAIRYTPRA